MTGAGSPRLRLGVDLGTCWSKGILWRPGDGAPGRAYVLRPPGPGADYRIPARVVWLGRRLYFGPEAEGRARSPGAVSYPSLKARIFDAEGFAAPAPPCPEGLSAEDLVILSLAHLLALGLATAREIDPQRAEPWVTLGAPAGPAEDPRYFEVMGRIGARALGVARRGLPPAEEGLDPATARRLLDEAEDGQVTLLPELDAALAWYHQSPWVPPGRYAFADVGAGFSRAACFEVDPGPAPRVKGAMRCYGVVHRILGADAIDVALARAAQLADPSLMRGDEGTLIVRHRKVIGDEIRRVMTEVFELYRQAYRQAFQVDAEAWGDYALTLAGGGSWIRVIREHMMSAMSRGPDSLPGEAGPQSLVNAGKPDGLYELDGRPFAGDPDFLIAAYGLARGGIPGPTPWDGVADVEALWAGAGRGTPSMAPTSPRMGPPVSDIGRG